jgi:catechol 2,3-dioxygenase-like lactoylglutathione lyase family enzyme
MTLQLERIDHIVLNCEDPDQTIAWYQKVLGMRVESYGGNRRALIFGDQKLNVRRTQTAGWKTSGVDAPGSLVPGRTWLDLCRGEPQACRGGQP